ncbi:tetratricopeptide repeat protein [Lysinibacillus telephonicus]|uniref:tetratricopeptide repeat protein n=1 Tax=Lysinibacillus telephonicus TaxID=1714840 RepID=UPI0031FCA8DD
MEDKMNEYLQEEVNEPTEETFKITWFSFLSHPIKTLEAWGLQRVSWYFIIIISITAGFSRLLSQFSTKSFGEILELSQILFITMLFGPISGLIFLMLSTLFAWGIGKIFRGKATFNQILNLNILASFPLFLFLPIWVIYIYVFGLDLFKEEVFPSIDSLKKVPLYLLLSFLETLIYCWSVLVFVIGFCKINQFKKAKIFFYSFTSLFLILLFGILIFSSVELLTVKKSTIISDQNNQAYELLEKEEYDEALVLLDSVLEKESENDTALANKGWILLETGRYEEAVKLYKKSLEIEPNDTSEYIFLGNAYYGLGKYEEAIDTYKEVPKIGVNKDNAIVYYQLGVSYYDLENYADSIFNFNQYLKFIPYDLDAYWYLVYAYEYSGNLKLTLEYLDKLIAIDPSISGPIYKGDLLSYYGNYSEALAVYEEVIENFPQFPDGYYGKAQILSVYNQPNESVSYLHEAYKIDPSYTEYVIEDPMFDSIRETQVMKEFLSHYATTDINMY